MARPSWELESKGCGGRGIAPAGDPLWGELPAHGLIDQRQEEGAAAWALTAMETRPQRGDPPSCTRTSWPGLVQDAAHFPPDTPLAKTNGAVLPTLRWSSR